MIGIVRIAGFGVALALACAAPTAKAYCRTLGCELGAGFKGRVSGVDRCSSDEACKDPKSSKPIRWENPCLTYAVQRDGSDTSGIDAATLQQLVADAFEVWEDVDCPGGGKPRFHAQFQGYVGCGLKETVCGNADQNVNVVMFKDYGWPPSDDGYIDMALTWPVGGVSSGRLVDADIEINSDQNDFSIDADGQTPLRYVLTHEVGHFLGLAHSNQSGAIMAPDYMSIMSSRALLGADDIAGICAIFPPGKAALECAEPPPPAYDECQIASGGVGGADGTAGAESGGAEEEEKECKISTVTHRHSGGCAFAGAPAGSASGALAALALILGAAVRRRQPASRQQRAPVL